MTILRGAQQGAVFAEYVVLLTTVAVGAAFALRALGPLLAELYLVQRAVLLVPLPV